MAKKIKKPTVDEIDEAVRNAIDKRSILLPSSTRKFNDPIAGFYGEGTEAQQKEEKVAGALKKSRLVDSETTMLIHHVVGLIHDMDTKGLYAFGDGPDLTPREWIEQGRKELLKSYVVYGMADGEATAETHLRAIKNRAREFAQATYPAFVKKVSEVN